jgi:peroxiredoxin
MTETPSLMVPLGTPLPSFALPDSNGEIWSPANKSSGTLVIFMCNHCPYVIHIASILVSIEEQCTSSNIQMVGINSNDISAYPLDSPENMSLTAQKYKWRFPYLFDTSQEIAKAFQATCTPDAFLYDASNCLYYRGQFDDSRPSNGVASGQDLIHAIQEMLEGLPPRIDQRPSTGCNIKWRV